MLPMTKMSGQYTKGYDLTILGLINEEEIFDDKYTI